MHAGAVRTPVKPDADGWVPVCQASELSRADVLRFDYGRKTFAVYRDEVGKLYSTDGICTHGNVHLANGLVKDGIIECPKHNGRFHLADGSPARAPICRGLATYPIEDRDGELHLNVTCPGGAGRATEKSYELRGGEQSERCYFYQGAGAEPCCSAGERVDFAPGDYLQVDISRV